MILARPSARQSATTFVVIAGVIAALHFAADVLIPIALALLLAFLLAPLVDRIQRTGANRATSVVLTTLVAFTILGAVTYAVAHQFLGLVESLPAYRVNLEQKIKRAPTPAGGSLERGVETVKELTQELSKTAPGTPGAPEIPKVQVVEPPPNIMQVVRGLFGPLIGPASTAAVVVVFTIFMLLQREDLRDRLVRLLGSAPDARDGRRARRCGPTRQPLSADAGADQRRAGLPGRHRALPARRTERAALGCADDRAALRAVSRPALAAAGPSSWRSRSSRAGCSRSRSSA